MLTVYRTDNRDPAEIVKERGFNAWQRLDAHEAMNVLRKFAGDDVTLRQAPQRAKKLIERLRAPVIKYDKKMKQNVKTGQYYALNLTDLSRLIKSQKTKDAFWISTDESTGCGGYTANFKYRMHFDHMDHHEPSHGTLGTVKQKITPCTWLSLWLDATHDNVAVDLKGGCGAEVSFLTSIPLKCIQAFKPMGRYTVPDWFPNLNPDRHGWYEMPHAPKVPSRLGRVVPQ